MYNKYVLRNSTAELWYAILYHKDTYSEYFKVTTYTTQHVNVLCKKCLWSFFSFLFCPLRIYPRILYRYYSRLPFASTQIYVQTLNGRNNIFEITFTIPLFRVTDINFPLPIGTYILYGIILIPTKHSK